MVCHAPVLIAELKRSYGRREDCNFSSCMLMPVLKLLSGAKRYLGRKLYLFNKLFELLQRKNVPATNTTIKHREQIHSYGC